MFMHIDMDAFFASIEQMVNPNLKGKPLIVGGRQNRMHTVVCAASYEAKALGVDSGMFSSDAFKLCPNLEFVVADSAKYIYTSEKIGELLIKFSPQVERFSVDEFVLETKGLKQIFGKPEEMALEIKGKIKASFGITCSIGIAKTRLLAKLASKLNKPDGLVILNEKDLPKLFKNTPVEKLCGVGQSLKLRLNSLGIETCWQLFSTPKEILFERFGKVGLWLYEAVRTNEDVPVSLLEAQNEPAKSIGHSYTLPYELSQKQAIFSWIRLLSEMVGRRLREQNLEAKTLYLYLHNSKHQGISRQKTFSLSTFDGFEIYLRCLFIIKNSQKSLKRVRCLGISASNLFPPERPYLFASQDRREALIFSLDKINNKFGDWMIFPASVTSLISSKNNP
ncbi:MAG: DNA polymerase IV [Candidatus Omnitrophota bacterium]|nr:DNA polymerase IV [Candidatus Omnitrophota bacterium]